MENRKYQFAKWGRPVVIAVVIIYQTTLQHNPLEPAIKYTIFAALVFVMAAYLKLFNIRFGALHKEMQEKDKQQQEKEYLQYQERQSNVNENIKRHLAEEASKSLSK